MAPKSVQADLHIHTCLSPCGDWDMSPRAVAETSRERGLDIIAVCDHNSAENAAAVVRAGRRAGIRVLPGMEICSREEVHLLAIFPDAEGAAEMQKLVYAHLDGENRPDYFGYQIVADEYDQVLGENPRLLIGATTLGTHRIAEKIRDLGGICIAAHVDRPAFGLLSQLGFVPPDLALDAVEISYRTADRAAEFPVPGREDLPRVAGSDAHYPADIGRARTIFDIPRATFGEIRRALAEPGGPRVRATAEASP